MNKNLNVKVSTIIRTACLFLAIINNCLTLSGMSPLPIEDEQLTNLLSLAFTTGAALWAWWKNNSFTKAAIEADAVKDGLKDGSVTLTWEEIDE